MLPSGTLIKRAYLTDRKSAFPEYFLMTAPIVYRSQVIKNPAIISTNSSALLCISNHRCFRWGKKSECPSTRHEIYRFSALRCVWSSEMRLSSTLVIHCTSSTRINSSEDVYLNRHILVQSDLTWVDICSIGRFRRTTSCAHLRSHSVARPDVNEGTDHRMASCRYWIHPT